MSDAADDDDPQLTSLRAVWLAMPDEEPPQRGLAELMAAARVKAEEMATPSLWQRIVALLRRPPVLALASVTVLIGGAVLVGQRGAKLEAEPPALRAEHDVAREPAGYDQPRAEAIAPAEAAPAEEKAAEPAPAKAPAKLVKKAPKTPAKAPAQKADDSARVDVQDTMARSPSVTADSPAFESEIVVGGVGAEPPPEATSQAPAATSQGPATSRTAALIAQARSAAARGDCAAATTLLGRVAADDAAAYRKAVASDAALKKCVVAQ